MRKLGKDMYTLLEIPKGDQAANWNQWGRNYRFFDAPVGLIFTIDKDLDQMSYLDLGIFLQTFMLAAKAKGLDTCAQGAWNQFWTATRRVLNVPEDDYIVCGLSLGYTDEDAPVNRLVSEREPVESFAVFHGFE
jgi:nitroreductase